MKIKSLYDNPNDITVESYLKMCGVKDIKEYLNPTGKYIEDPMMYDNMIEAVQVFKYHYLQNSRAYILCDSGDTDGITSTCALYKYMKLLNDKWRIKILIHEGKERGLQDEKLLNKVLNQPSELLIIPDSGTNDKEQSDRVVNNGTDVIVLDHHQLKTPIQSGVLVSNQVGNVDKYGSGAVVTHKFMQALDKEFNVKYSNKFIDLIALSIISDGMNVTSMQNRTYLHYGMFKSRNCIKNKFLNILFDKFIGSDSYNQHDLSFKIIPKINATCRSKDMGLKQAMIMAFLDMVDLEDIAETCGQMHRNQIDTVVAFIGDNIDSIDKSNNIVLFASEDVPRSYSGLLAGRIKNICDNKPTIIGKVVDGVMIGSLRSDVPLRKTLDECEYVDWCNGHEAQAGIQIQENNIQSLISYMNTLEIDYKVYIDVLHSFSIKSIPSKLFGLFDGLDVLWSNTLMKPMFHIKDIKISNKDIKIIGKTNRTLKFKSSNCEFILFGSTRKQKEELKLGIYDDNELFIKNEKLEILNIEVIGFLTINEWKNRKTNSIQIDKIEVH